MKTNVSGYKIVLLNDSGPTVDILVKVCQRGVLCCKNITVTALWGLKISYSSRISLLAEMVADDVLGAHLRHDPSLFALPLQ